MGPIEIILILVNFLSLLICAKNQSKKILIGVAVANISIALIHGIFEGFRFEIVFSYIFVILFTIYALLKTSSRLFEVKIPKALKIIIVGLSIVSLYLTSLMAYALPVFKLTKPTGNYAIGFKYFHFTDESRNEPFLSNPAKKRELMVKLYYPAKEDNSKPYAPYFNNSPELIKLFSAGYGMPDILFRHLLLVKTDSKEGLKLSDKEQIYPVVLFSHGAGASMEVETSQCEDLASHGYIVAAIDHTYISCATVFPDRIVSAREATKNFQSPDPLGLVSQIMVDDSEFIINELAKMEDGEINSIFKGRLNLDELGYIGHSIGGSAAYNMAIYDSRIKAAINLDGTVYITPPKDNKNMAPFLMIANDNGHVQAIQSRKCLMEKFDDMIAEEQKQILAVYGSQKAYDEDYKNAQKNIIGLADALKTSGNLFTIEGSTHMKFTDIGLYIGIKQLRDMIGIRGKTPPVRVLEITKSVTLGFFNQYLQGNNADSPTYLVNTYPELKKVDLN